VYLDAAINPKGALFMMNYVTRMRQWYRRPKSATADFIESLIIILPLVFLIRTIGFGLYEVPTGSMETTMLCGERFFADKFTILFTPPTHGQIITFLDPMYAYSKNPLTYVWQKYAWGPANWTKRVIGIPGDHIQGAIENGKPVVYRNGQKLDEPYLNHYPLIATFDYNRREPAQQFEYRSYVPDLGFDKQPFYYMTYAEVVNGKRMAMLNNLSPLRYPGTPCEQMSTFGTGQSHPSDIFDVQLGADEYWMMGDNRQGSLDSRWWGPLKKDLIHGKVIFRLYSIDTQAPWGPFKLCTRMFLLDLAYDLLCHPINFWSHMRWSRCLNIVR
jgi:signal peptidase I